jgi:hypothetical protein
VLLLLQQLLLICMAVEQVRCSDLSSNYLLQPLHCRLCCIKKQLAAACAPPAANPAAAP